MLRAILILSVCVLAGCTQPKPTETQQDESIFPVATFGNFPAADPSPPPPAAPPRQAEDADEEFSRRDLAEAIAYEFKSLRSEVHELSKRISGIEDHSVQQDDRRPLPPKTVASPAKQTPFNGCVFYEGPNCSACKLLKKQLSDRGFTFSINRSDQPTFLIRTKVPNRLAGMQYPILEFVQNNKIVSSRSGFNGTTMDLEDIVLRLRN